LAHKFPDLEDKGVDDPLEIHYLTKGRPQIHTRNVEHGQQTIEKFFVTQ